MSNIFIYNTINVFDSDKPRQLLDGACLQKHKLLRYYAYWIRVQVVATLPAGGIRLPLAIGAVVPLLLAFQTPLSGQSEPVRTVVPIG